MSDIQKQWCVFGWLPHSIGRVMRDNGSSLDVLYCEGQMYPWELWDPKYVRRFDTPEEAIAYLVVHSDNSLDWSIQRFMEDFPSAGKVSKMKAYNFIDHIVEAKTKDHAKGGKDGK